jgi:hypothetical protein
MTIIDNYNELQAAVQQLTDAVSMYNGSNSLIGIAKIKTENTKVKSLLVRHRMYNDKPKIKAKKNPNPFTHITYNHLAI